MIRTGFAGMLAVAVAGAILCAGPSSAQTPTVRQKVASAQGAQCPNDGASSAPLTRAQGEEIIRQLTAIRMLLQREALAPAQVRRPPPIHDVALPEGKGWHAIGNADAPVTMIEFTDLQCPFCRRFETTTFPELMKEYVDTGKVRFISMDMPLPMHQYALGAAEAEQCAAQQGKFWQFRDAVLSDQAPPTPYILESHASQLGLRTGAFQKCLETRGGNSQVQDGRAAAVAADIRGTPGFVVGRTEGGIVRGIAFTGARPLAFFERVIDGALNKSARTPADPGRKAGSSAKRKRLSPSGSSGSR